MIRVQFNSSYSYYNVDFSINSDVVTLKGTKFPKKVDTGFKAYRTNGKLLGDYSEYTEATAIVGGYTFRKKSDADTENK